MGNRTYQNASGVETYYAYDEANQLTHSTDGVNEAYFSYDANGNLTSMEDSTGTTYFEYTDAQLISSIHWPDDTWTYFYYDGLLRRYAISDEDGLRYLTWDQNGIDLLAESAISGGVTTVKAKYTHGYSRLPGAGTLVRAEKIVADESSSTTYYQYPVYDWPGNAVRWYDQDGDLIAKYDVNAFDDILHEIVPPEGNRFGNKTNCIRLKGGFILYLGRLYYAPAGRFMQEDPLPKAVSNPG